MALDSVESIMSCPSPRPRCTTSPRLAIVDMVDVYYSTSCLHHPATGPKRCAQKVERDQKCRRHRSMTPRCRVSPEATRVIAHMSQQRAFNKVTTHMRRHRPPWLVYRRCCIKMQTKKHIPNALPFCLTCCIYVISSSVQENSTQL
jgi:hypothetical protein